MIQEAYVSFEVAKLLKEKGFDENTSMVYMSYGDLCKCNRYDSIRNSNYNDITKNYFECTAPTHQMAMAWLREVHNLFICIEFDAPTFVADIYKMDEIDEHGCTKHIQPTIANCKTYEEAVEAALKYVLKNLI